MIRKTILLKLIALVILSFGSCDLVELDSKPKEKQWVYIELSTISKTDTVDYFFYGQINKSIIKKIDNNDSEGLFLLSKARFVNDDDFLVSPADGLITDISEQTGPIELQLENTTYTRVSIFMLSLMHI